MQNFNVNGISLQGLKPSCELRLRTDPVFGAMKPRYANYLRPPRTKTFTVEVQSQRKYNKLRGPPCESRPFRFCLLFILCLAARDSRW